MCVDTRDGHTRAVACLAFTADGVFLASGGHDAVISLWSMHTGNQVWLFRGHTGPGRFVWCHAASGCSVALGLCRVIT